MYEVDVLAVGNEKDADAIVMRFTRPDVGGMAHVVIDAGWQADGDSVVTMLDRYGAERVDMAIVTHPDGDHIGGMGKVFDNFDVDYLLIHRLDQRGGAGLPAAVAVKDLVTKAETMGTQVIEPRPGLEAFGALTILGPSDEYYEQLVAEQQAASGKAVQAGTGLLEALRKTADRFLDRLPVEEVPFGDGPGCGPRNNSSVITLLEVDDSKRALFTADAGVPAIDAALDFAESAGLDAVRPDLVQIPHHGSRRNASSALLNRLLGPIGQGQTGASFVSVVSETDPKHPAGRVVNAYTRRGYPYHWTAGGSLRWNSADAPPRDDYSPLAPGPALYELPDDA